MITNKDVAREIVRVMLEAGARIDATVALVQDQATPDELAQYRQAAGVVMSDLLFEIMNPIFEQHPDLKPPQLR